ncbi:MAG: tetraacyldisaccharide 4'-kinase [bacterium]
MKQYILRIVRDEQKGFVASSLRIILLGLSGIYFLFMEIRHVLYTSNILKSVKVSCPVISVGNITTGGTGKTPLVMLLAKMLSGKSNKVVIASRGYRRIIPGEKEKQDVKVVSDGKKVLLSVGEAGDEPYLMAQDLEGVGVVVGADRASCAEVAVKKLEAEIVILDDGFQHLRLKRDLDIVVIDCLDPFGGGYLIPRGLLRESLFNLSRADVLVLNRANLVAPSILKRTRSIVEEINPKALVIESTPRAIHIEYLQKGKNVQKEDVSFLRGKDVALLYSIGNPLSFEKTLKSLGAKILNKFIFDDHYEYDAEDITGVIKEAGKTIIVTTEKDAVRIKHILPEGAQIMVLLIEAEITKGASSLDEILTSRLK